MKIASIIATRKQQNDCRLQTDKKMYFFHKLFSSYINLYCKLMYVYIQGHLHRMRFQARLYKICICIMLKDFLQLLKGVFAKNERGYRRNAKNKRFRSLKFSLAPLSPVEIEFYFSNEQALKSFTFDRYHTLLPQL